MRHFAPIILLALLTGCTGDGSTRYPNTSPIYGARVSANSNPRGSEAFCRDYARQTAGNQYEGNRDSGDSIGANLFAREQAKAAGERAYRRCLSGRRG